MSSKGPSAQSAFADSASIFLISETFLRCGGWWTARTVLQQTIAAKNKIPRLKASLLNAKNSQTEKIAGWE
jgi:hypothetical protein